MTLEDIIEEIVGDISDQHYVVVHGVRPEAGASYVVDGVVPVRDLNRLNDWHLPDDEVTTVAGLVIHEAQMIPETGQTFTFDGLRSRCIAQTPPPDHRAADHAAAQAPQVAGAADALKERSIA